MPHCLRQWLHYLLALTLPALAAAAPPDSLQPGITRYPQAQQLWQQQQAQVVSEVYGNAQEAFISARPENIANTRVIRSELAEWPIDGAHSVTLGFFDELLYQFRLDYLPGHTERLLAALQQQYGPQPAAARAPGAWQWQQGGLQIQLRALADGSCSLSWEHLQLARKVAASHAEVYAAHLRQRLRIVPAP